MMEENNDQSGCLPLSRAAPAAQATGIVIWSGSEIGYEGLKHVVTEFGCYATLRAVDADSVIASSRTIGAEIVIILNEELEISGFDEITRIRQDLPEVAIVMIASRRDKRYVLAALDAGVGSYCHLTVPADQLCVLLKAASWGATFLEKGISEYMRQPYDQTTLSIVPGKDASVSITAKEVLSPRECEVLKLLAQGMRNREMATRLFVSIDTIKSHIRNIMHKLGSNDRTDTVIKAISRTFVEQVQIGPAKPP